MPSKIEKQVPCASRFAEMWYIVPIHESLINVYTLILEGKTVSEIANIRGVSKSTVNGEIKRLITEKILTENETTQAYPKRYPTHYIKDEKAKFLDAYLMMDKNDAQHLSCAKKWICIAKPLTSKKEDFDNLDVDEIYQHLLQRSKDLKNL